jgi:anti-anti-sigma regulatory factor
VRGMTTDVRSLPSAPLAVRRVGAGVWILRLRESLELRTVPALREAFRVAVDADAHDVVVDFATAETISPEGAAAIAEMVDVMHVRSGALWIAAPRGAGDGYTLRPVSQAAPDGLVGVSPALDVALTGAAA